MKSIAASFRSWLAAAALLCALPVAARAADVPAPADTPQLRAARLTGYLAHSLDLSKRQRKAVLRCTRQYLAGMDSLATAPEMLATSAEGRMVQRPAKARITETYEQALARILTPGQYNAYSWLQEQQPETSR